MYEVIKLGKVIDVVMGQAPPGKSCNKDGNGTPFVKAGEFSTHRPVIREWTTEPKKMGCRGDVFLCVVGATCGKINFGEDCAIGRSVAALRPKQEFIEQKFLYYFMSMMVEVLRRGSLGAAQTVISKDMINDIDILLPPLAEQQRIVAKLDAAFAEIDRAETVLVEKETEITNVFEAQVRRYFTENVLSAEYKKLSDVAEYFNGLTYSPKDVCDEGVIVLRSSNIQDGKIELSDLVRVKKKIKEKLIVKPNDILICSRNGSRRLIGKSALIDDSADEMTFGTFMMIVRSELNEYLQWFFKSSLFKQQIAQGEHTAINQITRYMLDEVVLPIPSLVERKQVNEEINFLDAKVRDVLVILAKQRNELLRLKAAILAQELQPPQSDAV